MTPARAVGFLVWLCLLVGVGAQVRAAEPRPAGLAGDWAGALGTGPSSVWVVFNFSPADSGGVIGTMDCPAVKVAAAPVTGNTSDWPRVRFAVPVREASFDGAFDAASGTIPGDWTRAGRVSRLLLRRAEPLKRWEGILDPGGDALPLVLHVGHEVGGSWFCAIDSPDQFAFGLPASGVSWGDPEVRIAFEVFKSELVGRLTPAGNQLSGIWRQGGRELPVTLNLTNRAPAKQASRATGARRERARAPSSAAVGKGPVETNWPSYRGPRAQGLAKGFATPQKWDVSSGQSIRWKTQVPGLGLSAPVIWGGRLFVTTAVARDGPQDLKIGLYGDIGAARDQGEQEWQVLCLDKESGAILWQRTATTGRPKIKRHTKASHANATAATDGRHVVAHFGSEGLYCYTVEGELVWKKDCGLLDSGYYQVPSAQWGYGSSPIIHDGRVLTQCDVQTNSFLAAYDIRDGRELWRTPRAEAPTWCTPTVAEWEGRTQIVCNGYQVHAGYDVATGRELWRFREGGDIPVPTPVIGHGLAFLTSAHGRSSPIYAVRLSALGDITLGGGARTNAHIAWSIPRNGSYLQTPVLAGDELYLCNDLGLLSCYDARSGQRHYLERLSNSGNGFTASPVAADGKIYCTAENGRVYVAALGPEFELLGKNELGEPCLTTPAISAGTLYFRTQHHVIAVGDRRRP